MSCKNGPGTTHYAGCDCHEEGWAKRLDMELAEIQSLRTDLALAQEELKWRRAVHGVTGEVDKLKAGLAAKEEAHFRAVSALEQKLMTQSARVSALDECNRRLLERALTAERGEAECGRLQSGSLSAEDSNHPPQTETQAAVNGSEHTHPHCGKVIDGYGNKLICAGCQWWLHKVNRVPSEPDYNSCCGRRTAQTDRETFVCRACGTVWKRPEKGRSDGN